jgi:hypothetical protein
VKTTHEKVAFVKKMLSRASKKPPSEDFISKIKATAADKGGRLKKVVSTEASKAKKDFDFARTGRKPGMAPFGRHTLKDTDRQKAIARTAGRGAVLAGLGIGGSKAISSGEK